MNKLPEGFVNRIKDQLGEEAEAFLQSYDRGSFGGLRLNRRKLGGCREDLTDMLSDKVCPVERLPWVENGYTYDQALFRPARHPYYHAGLYYLQEPSAMTPASRLPIAPGDRVLDLCAAPGGKATELGARLDGTGVLVANDVSASRARALLKNLELFGIPNVLVTTELPEKLADYFPGYFDKILIDAPCSGEGMFRKDPAIMKSWEKNGPAHFVPIQRQILKCAAAMLRPGGMLLYSTCTFSLQENEENMEWFMDQYPHMRLIPMEGYGGFAPGMTARTQRCVRIWPHRMNGEGHFLALWQKDGETLSAGPGDTVSLEDGMSAACRRMLEKTDLPDFWRHVCLPLPRGHVELFREYVYWLPEDLPSLDGLRLLRSGLFLGMLKNKRFEPGQALAMALRREQFDQTLDLSLEDVRVLKYLKGETLETENEKEGWILVCCDGYPIGFGKGNRGILKNKYLAGWRWQSREDSIQIGRRADCL